MILEKTKTYDQTLLIHELYKDNQVYTKFMPDWELLMKHMSAEIIRDAQIPSAYFRERTRQYSIKDVRKILSDAVIELDNGNWPENISKDEEMMDLLAQKKVFSSLAKRPPLETHRHEFKFEAKAEKGSYSEPTVRYVLEFVLCPVCEDLLSVYHAAVVADCDDGE